MINEGKVKKKTRMSVTNESYVILGVVMRDEIITMIMWPRDLLRKKLL